MRLDLSYLKSLVGDEPEVIEEMLTIFCEDVPVYLDTMKNAQASDDWDTVARTAHSLKSSMGFTGKHEMVEMAETLQHQKTKPEDPQIYEVLKEFYAQSDLIIASFKDRLAQKDFD